MFDSESGQSRSITVYRTEKGFGFTLRHFVVYSELKENDIYDSKEASDQDDKSKDEMMDTIFVKQVKDGGPAHLAGLRKGDRILAVNGQCVTGKSYSQVVALMQSSDQSLKLVVEPKDGDILQTEPQVYQNRENQARQEGGHISANSPVCGAWRSSYKKYESSAYASGEKPYSGRAEEIPNPPLLSRKSPEAVHKRLEMSKESWIGNEQEHGDNSSSKRKSFHISIDNNKDSGKCDYSLETQQTMVSCNTSSSMSDSKEKLLRTGPPPVQSRTSSRHVLLKYPLAYPRPYMDIGQQRAGSLDSICNPPTRKTVSGDQFSQDIHDTSAKGKFKAVELRNTTLAKSNMPSWHNQSSDTDSSNSSLVTSKTDHEAKRFSTSEQRKRFFDSHSNSVSIPDSERFHEISSLHTSASDVHMSFSTGKATSVQGSETGLYTAASSESSANSCPADTIKMVAYSQTKSCATASCKNSTNSDPTSVSDDPAGAMLKRTGVIDTEKTNSEKQSDHYGIAVSLNHVGILPDFNLSKISDSDQHQSVTEDSEGSELVVKQKRKLSLGENISREYMRRQGGSNAAVLAHSGIEKREVFLDHRTSWSSSSVQPSMTPEDIHNTLSADPIHFYLPKSTVDKRPKLIQPVLNQDEVDAKLARRTSYLMATRQRHSLDPEVGNAAITEEGGGEILPQTAEQNLDLAGKGGKQQKNIKKLKAFFGERTPKILDAQRAGDEPSSPLGELVKEGQLNCKLAMTDGKRATDRSWRPMWAILRGHVLLLYKDKNSVNPLIFEELPISIKSSIIDIAYDYTKKKNVFRLTTYNGSEYLFQADEHQVMLQWIKHMQENTNPDRDKRGVSKEELINRKIQQISSQERSPSGYQQGQLKMKQKSTKTLRSKSPAVYSPGLKQKRQPTKDDINESPKSSKTWKGKMVRKFRRSGSSSTTAIYENSDMANQATFGVPLEYCPASTFSEYVPFVVEVCTKMVEVKGLETQGIYRVPGNNGSVNMMQAEIDKGPDLVDMDNEKWLDVYVVGSLLKSFFRKLPEPLITEELYDAIIQSNRTDVQEKRMLKMKKVLHGLPEHNFETFHYLAMHLHRVVEKEAENKMDARNIAIVFGPTLIRTKDDSMVTMVRDMSDQCRIIESIVSHPDWFFSSWDEDVYVPLDSQEPDMMPISGMNQTLIHKAEHMELGDRGKEFSAKDLMSSVLSAANKRVRRREKSKGTDSIDVELDSEVSGNLSDNTTGAICHHNINRSVTYNERNIDAEIEMRSKKQQVKSEASGLPSDVSPTQSSSPAAKSLQCSKLATQENIQSLAKTESNNTLSAQAVHQSNRKERSPRDLHNAKLAFMQQTSQPVSLGPHNLEKGLESMEKISSEHSQKELALQVKRYPAYTTPDFRSFSTETSKPVIHYKYSIRQREITPPPRSLAMSQSRSYIPSPPSRVVYEDEQRQERRKREQAKHRIEMELQKTRKELELEEELSENLTLLPTTSTYNSSVASSQTPSTHGEVLTRYKPSNSKQVLSSSASCGMLKSKRNFYDDMDVRHATSYRVRTAVLGNDTEVRDMSSQHSALQQRQPLSGHIGSLDSLLERYEKVEQSQYDSDSDQDDFLQKLTSTFDKKLQSLGHQYSGAHKKNNLPVPGQVILAQGTKQQFVPSSFVEKFRDPSLHRVTPPKGDPNIGIACRFERRDIDSIYNSSHRDQVNTGKSVTDPLVNPCLQDKSDTISDNHLYLMSSSSIRPTKVPKVQHISKDTDMSLRHKSLMSSHSKVPGTCGGGPEKADSSYIKGSKFEECSSESGASMYSVRTASPPPSLRHGAAKKRQDRRRHTVGGTQDTEHYEALLAVTQPCVSAIRPSAWERLQPAMQQQPKTMQAWLKQQRGKNVKSTPSLVHIGTADLSPSFEFFKFDQFSPTDKKRQRQCQRYSESMESPLSPVLHEQSHQRTFTFESSI